MSYENDSLEKARREQLQCLEQARLGVSQGAGVDPADSCTDALLAADAAGQLDEFFAELKAPAVLGCKCVARASLSVCKALSSLLSQSLT